jgi:L-threonylcarbamoyladenylate synthase
VSGNPEIEAACKRLRDGELVAFPTETVYGLGADATQPEAVSRIYALKGRPSNHPVIVHLADASQIAQWARDIPPSAWELAERFWPGPLTLILPRAAQVPLAVTGGQDSVGLRVPAHPVAQALLRRFGGGIAAPSANRYGRVSPTRAEHVFAEFGDEAPLVLQGGDCAVGLESTIVSLLGPPMVLRPGGISRARIESVLGPLVEQHHVADAPRAPGTTVSHYAPSTPLRWMPRPGSGVGIDPWAAVLARSPRPSNHRGPWTQLADDPVQYGRNLYASLRALDQSGAPTILVEALPSNPDWEAVLDRLQRSAAAYTDTKLP